MPIDDDRPSLDDPDFAAKLAARARARARHEQLEPPPTAATEPEPALTPAAAGASVAGTGDATPAASIYDEPDFDSRPSELPDDPDALDEFFDAPEDEPSGVDRRLRAAIEWAAVIVGALVVALLIKTFLFQAFYIPSESMTPTLQENDRILVFKLDKSPERGDLMVFERPPNAPTNDVNELIKRAIAFEGETISIRQNVLYIDDQRLIEPYLAEGVVSAGRVWSAACANPQGDGSSCEVPDGRVFMMGDNRGNSIDSRSFGPIDTDLIVGRAVIRVWPLSEFGRL